jgi:glycosyl hydrolase family 46
MTTKQNAEKKDFFDKLSSLGGVFIAFAGFMATYLYNQNQIKLQDLKTKSEIKATEVEMLEKCMKYITSENPKEREFGYSVFSNMGFKELAINLIDIKNDSAGINVIKNIANSDDKDLSTSAFKILKKFSLSNNPKEKIEQIVNFFETGDINIRPEGVSKQRLDTAYFRQAEAGANRLGIKTTLGLLIVYDSYVHSGTLPGFLMKKVNDDLHGTPKDGVDEGRWLKTYLKYRIDWLENNSNQSIRISSNRPKFLLEQVEKGNYDLSSLDK